MAAKPAVTLDTLKKTRDRKEMEFKLRRLTQLKGQVEQAELEIDALKKELVEKFPELGLEKVEFEGFYHSLYSGTNVTISQDRLRDALMRHQIPVEKIPLIINGATARKPYVTIMTTAAKPKAEPGGITGQ